LADLQQSGGHWLAMTEPRELANAALNAGARAVERASGAVGDAYAAAKPKLRGWLHTVTSPVALAAGVVLIVLAPTGPATAAAAAYALTSFVLFTTSAIYHRGKWSPPVENRLKRLDHANIFLLIAGTYTPFAVLALKDDARIAVLSAVWGAAGVGVLFRVFWVQAPRWLYTALYIGLGWAAGFFVPQLIHGAGVAAFVLIATGGFLYTIGGLVYGLKRPNPSPKYFGFHEIFHACTVAAFACQYIAASFVVYRAA
jgi:hemolysin III